MKLWSKGFEPDRMIEEFTVGRDRELDLRLARYDVQGSMAHIRMLESIGLLKKDELDLLIEALEDIADVIERGDFVIEEGVEDVHSEVEFMLTARLGDIGKRFIPAVRAMIRCLLTSSSLCVTRSGILLRLSTDCLTGFRL